MEVYRDLATFPSSLPRPVVTVGNFDGVHLGHQKIIQVVQEDVQKHGGTTVVITFDPHPVHFLAPDRAPKLITTLDQKVRLLKSLGVQHLLILTFDRAFSHLSPFEFVRSILMERIGSQKVFVGTNFIFGYRQSGNIEALKNLGQFFGFEVCAIPQVELRGQRISSTRIRVLVTMGKISEAARLLGRPFCLEGTVTVGHGRGRVQTVPTLNLCASGSLIPKIGVYITETEFEGMRYASVTNVGHKPTFGEHELSIETHLLDQALEKGPEGITLHFYRRLRDEIKFSSPEILRRQIEHDIQRARAFFRRWERSRARFQSRVWGFNG